MGICFGCGGDSDDEGGTCEALQPCGGDIVGAWQVESVCFDPQALNDVVNPDLPTQCADAVRGAEATPSDVAIDYTAEGISTSTGSLVLQLRIEFSKPCLDAIAMQSITVSDAICEQIGRAAEASLQEDDAEATYTCSRSGSGCGCDARQEQALSAAKSTYTVDGADLVLDDSAQTFCISGDRLTVQETETSLQFQARRLP
jgi:hypothetical protein